MRRWLAVLFLKVDEAGTEEARIVVAVVVASRSAHAAEAAALVKTPVAIITITDLAPLLLVGARV